MSWEIVLVHVLSGVDVAVQLAGSAAADEEDFVVLRSRVAALSFCPTSPWWVDQDAEGIEEEGDDWVDFNFHERE